MALDGTAGSRPKTKYSSAKPTIETNSAKPSSVKMMANPRRAMVISPVSDFQFSHGPALRQDFLRFCHRDGSGALH